MCSARGEASSDSLTSQYWTLVLRHKDVTVIALFSGDLYAKLASCRISDEKSHGLAYYPEKHHNSTICVSDLGGFVILAKTSPNDLFTRAAADLSAKYTDVVGRVSRPRCSGKTDKYNGGNRTLLLPLYLSDVGARPQISHGSPGHLVRVCRGLDVVPLEIDEEMRHDQPGRKCKRPCAKLDKLEVRRHACPVRCELTNFSLYIGRVKQRTEEGMDGGQGRLRCAWGRGDRGSCPNGEVGGVRLKTAALCRQISSMTADLY